MSTLEDLVRLPLDADAPPPDASVPCAGCTRCCRGNSIVMLLPQHGDLLDSYEHEFVMLPGAGRGPILKRKPNGDCVYLGAGGCTIHDRAPVVCRVFDCRGAYLAFMEQPRQERERFVREGYVSPDILARGKHLLLSEDAA